MLFEFIRRPEGIYPHGAKKMSDPFSRHTGGHRHIGGKGGNPGTIISPAEYCTKNIDYCAQRISFMTAMIPVSAKREQRPADLQLVGIGGRLPLLILDPAQRSLLTFTLQDLQFPIGSRSCGEIRHECRLFPCRDRDAYG